MNKNSQILTVSELTKEIRRTLEENFEQVSVIGEISNFKSHISGHWYFSLKDSDAVINCTMWKGFNQYVFFTPQDGMKIIVNGKLTVYPPRGSYQLDIRSMKPAGLGELQEAFEKLKKKLEAEGLFDEKFKKPIPAFPKKIGVVTAIDGAAFRDLISVAERRFPLAEIIIAPARVQGSGAAESIVEGIKRLNDYPDIDVIIVARGGGSIEDLWAFNEEIVARAIFKSKIPIISGVGHEVDFTIADYVADLRAPTPSVAMEIVTPDISDIKTFIIDFLSRSLASIENFIDSKSDEVAEYFSSYGFKIPTDILNRKTQQVDFNINKILQYMERYSMIYDKKISLLSKSLETYDVQRSLRRGFVLVKQNSKFVTRAVNFNKEEKALLKFYDGEITTR
ncbi:MAG: exodeoxyribonuclease VII large subunit [Ignavibacteriaceae bacterium]|nr:exodeoxyribonuclease VII large subunit [Ignavibacteriaceae bacterium]